MSDDEQDPETPKGAPMTVEEESGGGIAGVVVTLGAVVAFFLFRNRNAR